jgi:hypothetical protein
VDRAEAATDGRVDEAGDLLAAATSAARAHDRADLAERLDEAGRRLAEPRTRVAVVGEYKQGKSSLVNLLLEQPVVPVDDDAATAVPTLIRFGDRAAAAVVTRRSEDSDDAERRPVPLERLAEHASEGGDPGRRSSIEVSVPRDLLASGIELVDMPGVGGLASPTAAGTVAGVAASDAVLFVSDASQELTAPELEFLRAVAELGPDVVLVLTKVDLYPEWRRIMELDVGHLRAASVEAEAVPVSGAVRERALESSDAGLDAESGYPDLVARLGAMVAGARDRSIRAAARSAVAVTEQLRGPLQAERSALADPGASRALRDRLEGARREAEALQDDASGWRRLLADGVADLASDAEHDFQARCRAVVKEAEAAIADGSADAWEPFEAWLYHRVTAEVVASFLTLASRANELGAAVAELFGASAPENLPVESAEQVRAGLEELQATVARLDTETLAGHATVAVQSGLDGGLMLGSFAGLAGIVMIPISIGFGLLLGWKAVSGRRKAELEARRQEARNAVARYVEEVTFRVGKESRDTVRRIERALRDAFVERADEARRSADEAWAAAERAAGAGEADRASRLPAVEAGLAELDAIRTRAVALLELPPETP